MYLSHGCKSSFLYTNHDRFYISSNLTWSPLITSIINTCSVSAMFGVQKCLQYDLDRRTFEAIYFSFIRTKLEYASIFGTTVVSQTQRLFNSGQVWKLTLRIGLFYSHFSAFYFWIICNNCYFLSIICTE
jgi:hypothetical protein